MLKQSPATQELITVAAARPRSDARTLPAGKDYHLALRFNGKRRGLAAFDWVAIWRGRRGVASRAFPLDALGFHEALRGAVATVRFETGVSVPPTELEIAKFKERRVVEHLRELALAEAELAASTAASSGASRSGQF